MISMKVYGRTRVAWYEGSPERGYKMTIEGIPGTVYCKTLKGMKGTVEMWERVTGPIVMMEEGKVS